MTNLNEDVRDGFPRAPCAHGRACRAVRCEYGCAPGDPYHEREGAYAHEGVRACGCEHVDVSASPPRGHARGRGHDDAGANGYARVRDPRSSFLHHAAQKFIRNQGSVKTPIGRPESPHDTIRLISTGNPSICILAAEIASPPQADHQLSSSRGQVPHGTGSAQSVAQSL
jgi:hypothetical protein